MNALPLNPGAVPRIFDRAVRLRSAHAWLLTLFSADVAAFVDLVTGPDLWFGPAYLLVICFAAWSIGWGAAQVTGIGCMVLTFAINGVSLYPYGTPAFAWNLGMRFIAISIVIGVIAGVRRAYLKEWWLARSDILTGALNRQAFFELAPSLINPQRWSLLLYADLDGLKKINDLEGHSVCDDCLRAYGAAVSKSVRRTDIFARLGGDEFVVLMHVKDEVAARAVAFRLHRRMNRVGVRKRTLKCSVGALIVPPGRASVDDQARRADHLMYRAKLRGACLEIGLAPQARPVSAHGARAKPCIANAPDRRAKKIDVERRSGSKGHVRHPAPR